MTVTPIHTTNTLKKPVMSDITPEKVAMISTTPLASETFSSTPKIRQITFFVAMKEPAAFKIPIKARRGKGDLGDGSSLMRRSSLKDGALT